MRKLVIFLCLFIVTLSYEKDEPRELYYEYDSNQPTTIEANVVIMEHSLVTFESMELEVNADYYHRYGIHIQLNLNENRESLPDNVKFGNTVFLPKKREKLTIYIVPPNYINLSGVIGYALPANKAIIIADRHIRSRTLAHEIGHIYGLQHIEENNNVMKPLSIARWRDKPNDFLPWQIDTILGNLNDETAKTTKLIQD